MATGKLTRLRANPPGDPDSVFEFFLDEESGEIKAIAINAAGMIVQVMDIGYEDIAEGIRYPISFIQYTDVTEFKKQMPAEQRAQMPDNVITDMAWSEVKVNEKIDPATFHFTTPGQ